MRTFFALLLSLSLVAVACGGSDSAGGDGANPLAVDPDSLPEDTVLFDGEGDDGTSQGDSGGDSGDAADGTTGTSSDTAPSTPASTPSVVIYRYGTIGGWTGSGWNPGFPESAAEVGASAGDVFQLAGIGIGSGTVTGGEPFMICEAAGGFGVETSPELTYDYQSGVMAIGVRADWNATPRTPDVTSGGGGAYQEQVATLLGQNGIDPSLATVDSVARIDLEGDGVDEVVVTANNSPNWPQPEAGNYSLVFLRKLVDEQVQTSILFSSFIPENTDDFFWVRARLGGFADLNGDDKLEILMATEYYEGDGVEAFEYVNDDLGPVSVMGTGCGA